eukprot:1143665-Pelagomonas_calceolata.AAC.5
MQAVVPKLQKEKEEVSKTSVSQQCMRYPGLGAKHDVIAGQHQRRHGLVRYLQELLGIPGKKMERGKDGQHSADQAGGTCCERIRLLQSVMWRSLVNSPAHKLTWRTPLMPPKLVGAAFPGLLSAMHGRAR